MDLETIIIGLIALAVFVVPIMYNQRRQKAKTNELLKEFMTLGAQQQLNITKYDFWNQGYAIGLDESLKKLFYFKKKEDTVQKVVIGLADAKRCSVVNLSRDVNGNKTIDLIGLRLTFSNPKSADQQLEFYSIEDSLVLSGELELANKWNTIINEVIGPVSEKHQNSATLLK